ncbi:hypothetical protein ACM66B_002544 [Microbotryomycetes sp. NB124-2]
MSFGPGNAFGSFASSVAARPPRRINSSGSFKDSTAQQHHAQTGPTPVDHVAPPVWQDLRQREHSSSSSNATHPSSASGHFQRNQQQQQANNENADPLKKPFVYSREFILSLYDPDKASKRPLEMVSHDVATSDRPTKPWALQEYRPGEKDLFATTLHPPNARNRSNQQSHRLAGGLNGVSDSLSTPSKDTQAGQTLDLASLGALPRERDRQALSTSSPTAAVNGTARNSTTPGAAAGGAAASLHSPVDRSALGALGAARRTRSGLGSAGTSSMGIVGGVLGGIGTATSATSARSSSRKDDADAKSASGRWRRTDAAEDDDKRPSAFGSRRFPLADDPGEDGSSQSGSPVADSSWEHVGDAAQHVGHRDDRNEKQNDHDSLTQQATSILGSLALDSADDPVVPAVPRQTQAVSAPDVVAPQSAAVLTPPPGFEQKPVENLWQYRDPSGQVHEFSAEMMHEWYTQSFFQMDLRVRRSNELEFETLENLIRRTGNIDSPFLTAPPQARTQLPPPASVSAAAWPATSASNGSFNSTPTAQRTSSFHEDSQHFSGSGSPFVHHSAPQQQQLNQRLQPSNDPWAAAAAPVGQWDDSVFRAALLGQAAQQTSAPSPFQQQQQQHTPQSAAELLRQLSSQQPQRIDTFAQSPSHGPGSPFYNSPAQYAAPDPWAATQQQPQQQPQPPQPQQSQPAIPAQPVWQSRNASLDVAAASPIGTPAISPIGPPQSSRPASAAQSPTISRAAAPATTQLSQEPATVSSWNTAPTQAPEPVAELASREVAAEREREHVEEAETEVAPAAETKTAPTAPWLKEEEKVVSTGPSLREIQEAEAREAEKRKAAARVQAAQANALAAQRAAAAEAAEQQQQLPASAGWGSPSAASASKPAASAAAPWSKPKTATGTPSSGKTLKEIQEEEQRRKKELAASQAAAQAQAAAALGHPAPAAMSGLGGGSSWTTIATRTPPKSTGQASGARSVIPGLPVSAVSARAASKLAGNAPPAPSIRPAAPAVTPVVRASTMPSPSPVSAPSIAKPSVIRSVSVSGAAEPSSTAASAQYDIENPPPPSAEFMKWCRDSLKGLTVPMDEFIRMLLSFPLDASADVLEIISDSVYANSSTLDGRRFANEYTSRRKVDAAARFPSLFKHLTNGSSSSGLNGHSAAINGSGSAKKVSNMAELLKSQPVAKTPEWSVKVSASTNKKKKAASGQTIPGLK